MKAILMSIRPQWCKKIFNGSKTIEVRKSRPSLDMPFTVYVYCTKQKLTKITCMHSYLHKNEPKACKKYGEIAKWCHIGDVHVNSNTPWSFRSYGMHGKVIGSFVCDRVRLCIPFGLKGHLLSQEVYREMCLTKEQLDKYGGLKTLYGWHITKPKLFDKPRELREFYTKCDKTGDCECEDCLHLQVVLSSYPCDDDVYTWCGVDNKKPISRPPQSYCFVETDEK